MPPKKRKASTKTTPVDKKTKIVASTPAIEGSNKIFTLRLDHCVSWQVFKRKGQLLKAEIDAK